MTNYTINEQQITQYKEQGYFILKNAIPKVLLSKWQTIATELEQKAMNEHDNNIQGQHYCVVNNPVGARLMRYDDVIQNSPTACLELLATPAMMAVARQISGEGTVPLQMDVLYKQQHPHPVINWHQDAPHSREFPYLNIGVYLDDAPEGDGCLRYVPGTQHELVDIEQLSAEYGWELPNVIEQSAQAGDILIQDMMILHGSQPKRSEGVRRTIYTEA
jgi:ectoine hydroxylase-related dioxygenase (phytanoyl-CoA dioxygenase family)